MTKKLIHRYIPNSAPETRQYMLDTIGVKSVDEIYEELPVNVRFNRQLDIQQEPMTEMEVSNYFKRVLAKNVTTENMITFLGAGCCKHYVPAICGEINSRNEFVTAYAGNAYCDRGRMQAIFEGCSMVGDLLDMEVVATAVYDVCTACGDAVQMARRYTGRPEILVPETMMPDSVATMRTFGAQNVIIEVASCQKTGKMDLEDLKAKLSDKTAAVFVENPSYLGYFEDQLKEIGELAHDVGALFVVVAEAISLGVVEPPSHFGADLAILSGQPLGLHQNFGGSQCAYIACKDDEKLVKVIPTYLFTACDTVVPGEIAFHDHGLYDRTFYEARDEAESFSGTVASLWVITNAAYLSLMGHAGLERIAKVILCNGAYLRAKLNELPGVSCDRFQATPFKEFVCDFNGTGKTVEEINAELIKHKIIGGKDLSKERPDLGQCALFCVTEVLTKADLDQLVNALEEVLR